MLRLALLALLFLAPPPAISADETLLLSLSEDSIGHLMRTRQIQLDDMGVVAEELHDFYLADSDPSSAWHVVKPNRTLSSAQLAQVRRYIKDKFRLLPGNVNADRPIGLDAPSRSICVYFAPTRRCSVWESYEDKGTASPEAQRFHQDWEFLLQVLGEPGPNNSFKPNPLR